MAAAYGRQRTKLGAPSFIYRRPWRRRYRGTDVRVGAISRHWDCFVDLSALHRELYATRQVVWLTTREALLPANNTVAIVGFLGTN
jgi:hypothetical protein